MNVFKSLSDLSLTARMAKGRADRAGRKIKRADQQMKRVKGGGGRSERSTSETPSEPTQQPTSGSQPEQGSKPGVLVPVVAGVVGAIGAAPLSLFVADNADDRLVLALIGLPLGAILTVGVVFAYRSAGLIDR